MLARIVALDIAADSKLMETAPSIRRAGAGCLDRGGKEIEDHSRYLGDVNVPIRQVFPLVVPANESPALIAHANLPGVDVPEFDADERSAAPFVHYLVYILSKIRDNGFRTYGQGGGSKFNAAGGDMKNCNLNGKSEMRVQCKGNV